MAKVRILRIFNDGIHNSELKTLLEAAGFEVEEADNLDNLDEEDLAAEATNEDAEGEPAEDNEADEGVDASEDDEIVVVVLTPECQNRPDLDGMLAGAVARGSRVVGIWPRGAPDGKVPAALEKYGSDVVVWDPDRICGAVGGAEPRWETPAGVPRSEPVTRRNKC